MKLCLKFVAIVGAVLLDWVSGHGYMKSPRSRNYVAYQDGVWYGGDESHPEKENCPHCLNLGGTSARCGLTSNRNYDTPRNHLGNSLEWTSQATYQAGATIDIESLLSAHHKGHIEVKACPVTPNEVATQACFDSNPLEFISDELYGAPKDDNYPIRGYLAPSAGAEVDSSGVTGFRYNFKYKLPDNISGNVLLQWYYITGNSCTAPGYDAYPFPAANWYSAGLPTCPYIPPDGVGVPEQFWNCGEIFIEGDSSPSPPITMAPSEVDATGSPNSSPSNQVTAQPSQNSSDNTDKTIIGYYASWQQYPRGGIAKPENMDFSKVDRVNFAFFQTDVNGFIYGTDKWGDPLVLFGPKSGIGTNHCSWDGPSVKNCDNHYYEKGLISLVHAVGAEIYPSIGGWTLSDAFPQMASTQLSRAKFAQQCAELIEAYDFDGIDIDWEYPGYEEHSGTPADKQNFNLLLSEVRLELDNLGSKTGRYYGLTAALPCGPSHIENIDVQHLADVLDELLLMTYDLHGSWDSVTGINAPLYYQGFGSMQLSVDACVNTWKSKGAPASKIGIGLAFYGRSFAYASGLNTPHSGIDANNWESDDGIPQYFSIINRFGDMTSVRHDVSKTPFAFFKGGSGLVSYDDERSICEKTEYVIDKDLKGFLIWELSSDLMPDLTTPLLDAVNEKLLKPDMNCAGGTYTIAPSQTCWTSVPTTLTPTTAPTGSPSSNACSEIPSAEFFLRIHDKKGPQYKECKWLAKQSENKIINFCAKNKSYEGIGPANTVCFETCDSCPSSHPSAAPSKYQTLLPTAACSENPSAKFFKKVNTNNEAKFGRCNWLADQSDSKIEEMCARNDSHDGIESANIVCPKTCDSCPTHSPSNVPSEPPTERPSLVPLTKAPSPGATCSDGFTGYIALNECTQYQYCMDGAFTGDIKKCAEGYLFDEKLQNINYYYSVWCNGLPPVGIPQCPIDFTGLMAVDDCAGFRHCSDGIVVSEQVNCAAGQLFDEGAQGCNWEHMVNCNRRKRNLEELLQAMVDNN
eukprot:CAMPEP_0194076696 /NCGR_PEP_ID=MMETSP0149-20130528/3460_1 /TAXON_ID=122233 /ORGANISM="Chaetoceros debilis, Strain MM31A-1" /LENGTH=1024 /DNA_ID=CAMNT_0038757527 /DNA_START=190 /DNA_END=3264 /DNA_ORIENTATION=+